MGNLSLLQGIFPTQGSNPGILHCRRILYELSHREAPLSSEPLLSDPEEVAGEEVDAEPLWSPHEAGGPARGTSLDCRPSPHPHKTIGPHCDSWDSRAQKQNAPLNQHF